MERKKCWVRFYTLVSGSPNPVYNPESMGVGPCIELNTCWTWAINPAVTQCVYLYHCSTTQCTQNEMMSELKKKSKRKFNIDGPSRAEDNGMERKLLREEQIDELLLRPLLDGTRILLSDIKRRKILNDWWGLEEGLFFIVFDSFWGGLVWQWVQKL